MTVHLLNKNIKIKRPIKAIHIDDVIIIPIVNKG